MKKEIPSSITTSGFFYKNPALKIKEFQAYLMGRVGIIFALNMQSTILYYWVYHITNSKLSLGLVGLAEVIPAISCSLFAGHYVDEHEKRKMVLTCLTGYLLTAICLFGISMPQINQNFSVSMIVCM